MTPVNVNVSVCVAVVSPAVVPVCAVPMIAVLPSHNSAVMALTLAEEANQLTLALTSTIVSLAPMPVNVPNDESSSPGESTFGGGAARTAAKIAPLAPATLIVADETPVAPAVAFVKDERVIEVKVELTSSEISVSAPAVAVDSADHVEPAAKAKKAPSTYALAVTVVMLVVPDTPDALILADEVTSIGVVESNVPAWKPIILPWHRVRSPVNDGAVSPATAIRWNI